MPFDLSLPLFAATGLALAALVTYFGWPHIRVRTYNKTHGDLRVIEVALMLSRSARPFLPAAQPNHGKPANRAPGAEFVIYMTLKAGNL
ncbi:MAG TPA: hypothetical protein VKT99_15765 [Xanthobacteraceae bacterium]|jgi:hypothetical protein|nr:hypothetical protein [Xanthobacteraceae bacterium]